MGCFTNMLIYLNLFFLTKKNKGGVYRFAWNMLIALDQQINKLNLTAEVKFIGLLPRTKHTEIPDLNNISIKEVSSIKSHHMWEQFILPLFVKKNFLINLCNFAPVFKSNQLCVIHDALVFRYPESYSKKIVYLSKIFYRLIVQNTNYIATVSEFSASEILKCIGKPKNEIIILGNSAENFSRYESDNKILVKYALEKNKYALCVFSQENSFYKNVDRFIKAIAEIKFKFVIVGNASAKYFTKNTNILNIGFVSNPELKSLYQNAHSFIMPSMYEGFGIPILEAMSSGCMVICSDIPVFHEIAASAAIYFDPYNKIDMANIVQTALSQQPQKDLIQLGYQQVAKYKWNNLSLKLLQYILYRLKVLN